MADKYSSDPQVRAETIKGTLPAASVATGTFIKTVNIQTFTATGTYTPTSGMVYCVIECVGGGAGGGGTADSSGSSTGGGGGSGSYSRKLASAADIGASKAVTIGAGGAGGSAGDNDGSAGGDTSLGTLCIGKGGSGGAGSAANSQSDGGAGGVAGTGDVTVPGNAGEVGFGTSVTSLFIGTGKGAGSYFGGGPKPAQTTVATGPSASNYGAGGSGGNSWASGGAGSGGAGAAGLVIVTEFIA